MTMLNGGMTDETHKTGTKDLRDLTAEESEAVSGGINPQPLPPRGDD